SSMGVVSPIEVSGVIRPAQFADKSAPTLLQIAFCPEGVGASGGYDGCDGLRSGPETDHLGCVWRTEVAGFAAGSRQFADKRSVARAAT
ncbi:hypothetical protein A258_06946, partial [Pseudomonas syringae pv. actinidiae ICMP 19104]